jgi:EPS-associated MarR family transcriptional regulator
MSDEIDYRVLKLVEARPDISQRELAAELGVSLGKANYCLKALIEKGWVKANNFKNNRNKLSYAYLLTPRGIKEKAQVTRRFLDRKKQEYESLKREIAQLQVELQKFDS